MEAIGNALLNLIVFSAFAAPALLGCLIALIFSLFGFSAVVFGGIAIGGIVAGVVLAIRVKRSA